MSPQAIAGFVVGEGCFTRTGTRSFTFKVGLGRIDRGMCETMQEFFGCGFIVDSPRRKPHYDDESAYVVRAFPDLTGVIVPFMDAHLPPSYKRSQYERWRDDLLGYWETRAKRVRRCTVDGCDQPRRAKDLCRRHYYVAFGK